MDCRAPIRACSVVDVDCTAPANLQAARARCTCHACGQPVCHRCSVIISWHGWPKRRVCFNCVDDRLSMRNPGDELECLRALAARYQLRDDWHEPGEYHGDLQAVVKGTKFDNAGVAGEKQVVLKLGRDEIFTINLATLFALAARR